ncbi:MAG: FAD-dependent oxidoreductase, partial [Victivallales bacterium]|nr:FAD-dependent oxidoreductase [Victivallales bacterium]
MDFEKSYDVVVVGSGVAGVAAALAAARRGKSVALIEKQSLIGGLATSGLVYVYLPLCDGNGRQILFSIPEELLKLSLRYSPFDLSDAWGGKVGAGFP